MAFVKRWAVACLFCGLPDWLSRPLKSSQQFVCSVECLAAHEAGLADKLRAIPMPPEEK